MTAAVRPHRRPLSAITDTIAALTGVRAVRREAVSRHVRLGGTPCELRHRYDQIPDRLRQIADQLESELK